jgi:hypothetical protein
MRKVGLMLAVVVILLIVAQAVLAEGEMRLRAGFPWPQSPYDGRYTLGFDYWTAKDFYASLGYASTKWDAHIGPIPVDVKGNSWNLTVGKVKEFNQGWYAGAGVGLSRLKTKASALGFSESETDNHFLWEAFGGKKISSNGFVQVRYQDGGHKANRLVAVEAGFCF